MKKCLLVAAGLYAALIATAGRAAADARDVYKKSVDGVVWVVNPVGKDEVAFGSGFVIDTRRKLVVTNYHVTEGKTTMSVYLPYRNLSGRVVDQPQSYLKDTELLRSLGYCVKARVVAADPAKDLAVLALESLPRSSVELPLATDDPDPGELLHLIGNPGGRNLWRWTAAVEPRLTHVSGKQFGSKFALDYRELEYATSSFGGNSGGPVLNGKGQVVGVHSRGGGEGGMAGGAVHFSEVTGLLATVKPYRAFSVENTSTEVMAYEYRWGDGGWKAEMLPPGKHAVHVAADDGEPAEVRFASGDGERTVRVGTRTVHLGRGGEATRELGAERYALGLDRNDDVELRRLK